MKLAALLPLLLVVGCTEHGRGGAVVCLFGGQVHQVGEVFSAGDGCNSCECISDGTRGQVSCTDQVCLDAGSSDGGSPNVCASAPPCDGPLCNGVCCGAGERCEGSGCSCNGGAACSNGDICAPAGPVAGETCGIVCCGSPNNPCPL